MSTGCPAKYHSKAGLWRACPGCPDAASTRLRSITCRSVDQDGSERESAKESVRERERARETKQRETKSARERDRDNER